MPEDVPRGLLFLILAIAVDLVVYGFVYDTQSLGIAMGAVTAALLVVSLALGALGFLRVHRARWLMNQDQRARLDLGWAAFIGCVVLDGIIAIGVPVSVVDSSGVSAVLYTYLGFLSALAMGLVLLWTVQALAPHDTYLPGVLALLSGIAGAALESNPLTRFVSADIDTIGRSLGLVSLSLWLVLLVEAHMEQRRRLAPGPASQAVVAMEEGPRPGFRSSP